MESIFIEIDKCVYNTNSNIIIGVIYRMPNACVDVFTDRLTDIMNVIEKEHKLCYIMGDLNINFLKANDHKSTGVLLDVLYSYSVFPLITKPTRVTEKTATLIDHIWTNSFGVDSHHIQGILCTSMTDHYAIFHIAGNTSNDNAPKCLQLMRRDMSQKKYNEIHWWNETYKLAKCAWWKQHTVGLRYISWYCINYIQYLLPPEKDFQKILCK